MLPASALVSAWCMCTSSVINEVLLVARRRGQSTNQWLPNIHALHTAFCSLTTQNYYLSPVRVVPMSSEVCGGRGCCCFFICFLLACYSYVVYTTDCIEYYLRELHTLQAFSPVRCIYNTPATICLSLK